MSNPKIQRIRLAGTDYDINVHKDWQENDPNSVSYIENRTHYELQNTTIFEGQSKLTGNSVKLNFKLLPNTEYQYYADTDGQGGDAFEETITTDGTGNVSFGYVVHDISFSIKGDTLTWTSIEPGSADYFVKISGPAAKQLDPKYIPIDNDTLVVKSVCDLTPGAYKADGTFSTLEYTWEQMVENGESSRDSEYYTFPYVGYGPLSGELRVDSGTEEGIDYDIVVPASVTNIYPICKTIVLPETTTYFEGSEFVYTVYVKATTPPILSEDAFFEQTDVIIYDEEGNPQYGSNNGFGGIIVPVGCGELYKTTGNWSLYAKYITEGEMPQGSAIKQVISANLPLELECGSVENSLQTPGATALTSGSIAIGNNAYAGCKGYHFETIDFANRRLYLSNADYATKPNVLPRYIFTSYFSTASYTVYADGKELTPVATKVKFGDISRAFNIYRSSSPNISIHYPDLSGLADADRTHLFIDWQKYSSWTTNGREANLDTPYVIIAQYGGNALQDSHLQYFKEYCAKNRDATAHDSAFVTGYTEAAIDKYFYTINKVHYLTDSDVKGDRDATIASIDGNCITWKGDIGYNNIDFTGPVADYDYSFMIPDFPDPSPDAVELKPAAIVVGTNNKSIGRATFVGGTNNTALQDYGFIGGINCQTNYMDFSFGSKNIANGQYGVTLGGKKNIIHRGSQSAAIIGGSSNTIESGATRSFIAAGNLNTIKNGAENAFVAGAGLTANKLCQTVLGRHNVADSSKLFILGGGTEDAPKNIFTVDTQGRVTAGADPRIGSAGKLDLVTRQYVDKLEARIKTLEDIINNITTLGVTKNSNGQLSIN
jgi:hypothetical protein